MNVNRKSRITGVLLRFMGILSLVGGLLSTAHAGKCKCRGCHIVNDATGEVVGDPKSLIVEGDADECGDVVFPTYAFKAPVSGNRGGTLYYINCSGSPNSADVCNPAVSGDVEYVLD